MKTYQIIVNEQKKALRQLVKERVKTLKGFPKACYYLAWFFKLVTIVATSALLLHMIFWSHDWAELILLVAVFLPPFAFYLFSKTVYVVTINRDFSFRHDETITLCDDGFVYRYHDNRSTSADSIYVTQLQYDKVTKIRFNSKTKMLTVNGDFIDETYQGGKVTETFQSREFDFMDVYVISILELLEKHCSNAEIIK